MFKILWLSNGLGWKENAKYGKADLHCQVMDPEQIILGKATSPYMLCEA